MRRFLAILTCALLAYGPAAGISRAAEPATTYHPVLTLTSPFVRGEKVFLDKAKPGGYFTVQECHERLMQMIADVRSLPHPEFPPGKPVNGNAACLAADEF